MSEGKAGTASEGRPGSYCRRHFVLLEGKGRREEPGASLWWMW